MPALQKLGLFTYRITIFLKPLILPALRAGKIKGFRVLQENKEPILGKRVLLSSTRFPKMGSLFSCVALRKMAKGLVENYPTFISLACSTA